MPHIENRYDRAKSKKKKHHANQNRDKFSKALYSKEKYNRTRQKERDSYGE